TGVSDQERVDVLLRVRVNTAGLAGEDTQRLFRRQIEQPPVDETVVDDDVGTAQERPAPEREQARIAGAGSHESHPTSAPHQPSARSTAGAARGTGCTGLLP